ncbi:mRNA surveillance protein pelota [Pyrococcus furiosus DSM 3638]|uniref:Protein pelota homolog n=3 Tax=Pyrococcus furiosus TaxID=2261 RepID=PELO_PYRFU|nr:mRNA surveillance protein pelota [Pyrococcus furiosus]Q8U150.1 RecName: Full=Protein pelota homolog [Pyrococcus furiosus DSM 3638]AAL81503.1 cell division protein pelota [Pyrococcus furiosus DSM 3638]AFN04160.1 cell division protein pelota [Pyrococcus furiosus COM1]QEK79013.1 mRNA surveillance protein pelota [Pyrococcus furiosus DSM 3638]
MEILEEKPKEGKIKIKAETLDDLWHLYHIISEGDVVYAKTLRKQAQRSDSLRPEKVEAVPVFLGIKAEKINLHRFANQLRITGPIIYASREDVPLGRYHTLTVEPGTVITIQKEKWKNYHIERLKEAIESSKKARVMIVAIEDGEAEIAIVREYGLDFVGSITYNISGKRYNIKRDDEEKKFFHEVAKSMEELMKRENIEKAIVAGPGFYKENFVNFLRENYPELAKKVVTDDTSMGGRTGIYEVIKRGTVDKVYTESRISKEIKLVEKVIEEIAKNGLVAYGLKEVEEATNYGAVETLIVLDSLLKGELREKIEELMELARNLRASVVVVSSEHEGGDKLKALGGIAALLRFKIK